MILTVKGLVIREVTFGEADKLFDLLTDSGIRTVRARGVRKPGSKYAAVTQMFSYGEYCLRQTGDRLYLDSAVSLAMFYGLRQDLEKLALASYFAELIRKTATDQPQPQLLRLFLLCLHYLEEGTRDLMQIKGIFELRLVTELGMMPNLVCCNCCMRYLPPAPILRIASADFTCADCCDLVGPHDLTVTPAALQAARHAIYSEADRLFAFRVKGESLRQFALYAEQYLLHRIGTDFPTLRFFHDLAGNLQNATAYNTGESNTYD